MRGYSVAGLDIVVARLDDEVRAFVNRCPHQGGSLSRARLDGDQIVCPWHQWRFDARSGRAAWPAGYEHLISCPARVDGGQILVAVD